MNLWAPINLINWGSIACKKSTQQIKITAQKEIVLKLLFCTNSVINLTWKDISKALQTSCCPEHIIDVVKEN